MPKLPAGLQKTRTARIANALHSLSIHLLRRARRADKETGLSAERLSLLSVLVFAGPQTINALADIEGVSSPAISRIVKSLEEEGLAIRTRSADDRRVVTVRASAKGERLMELGRRRRIEAIMRELEILSPRELAALEKVGVVLEMLEAQNAARE